ncbi:hypothetical protein CP980_02635 [Streptomyces vinaceus]|uniref:Uncharacterized protein n=1 Tax=Streptomyces vinaceus TaxID=1960 RepID=A0A5J6J8Y5_STRVI|nr:hypothetical protein [Streptomyces vinaceus]QEV44116.1 hypothetical protein CP980_02635 [Streptomyces vinaceus]
MIEHHAADSGEGQEADVLGSYLEVLRARLTGERFEVLIRAVQTTCALLADGREAVLEVPGDAALVPDLHCEYLSLMAVMITGHLDHRLVELAAPDGGKGWAVVDNTRPGEEPAPAAAPLSPCEEAEREWIAKELDGIVRATDGPGGEGSGGGGGGGARA